jgi:Tfp pilus assembly protein FimV
MKMKNTLIFTLLGCLMAAPLAFADSKRIEVYALSQNYWDTQSGETLGEIATQLLPNNPGMRQKLMDDIVSQNPHAFQDGNPDLMQANTRLWLSNGLSQTDSKADPARTQVESFSWGNIKRPKR